jgi:hypothetical protein
VTEADVCMLGGMTCDELSGETRACAPSEYCIPGAYCASSLCMQSAETCLFDSGVVPTAKLKCSIGFKPSSENHADVCTTTIPFELPLSPTQGSACAGPSGEMLLGPPMPGTPLAFSDTLSFTSRDTAGSTRTMSLKMRHEYDCHYKAELAGELALDAVAFDDKGTFVQLWLSRSGGPVRKLLVPLELQPINDCSQAGCQLVLDANDSLATCASR